MSSIIMKKFFTILLMLFAVISMAMAQPATMTKGQVDNSTEIDKGSVCRETRDSLYVEILTSTYGDGSFPANYHFPNDSSLRCPIGWVYFETNYIDTTHETNYWHTWETSLKFDDHAIFGYNNFYFLGRLDSSCYIKVTVTDEYGNTGSDSGTSETNFGTSGSFTGISGTDSVLLEELVLVWLEGN